MQIRICFILTIVFHLDNAQVYFPEEVEASPQMQNSPFIPSNINLTEIRGTTLYEKYVERIISGGITKLTLAINKVLLQNKSGSRNNIVFAPMSIAGKKKCTFKNFLSYIKNFLIIYVNILYYL